MCSYYFLPNLNNDDDKICILLLFLQGMVHENEEGKLLGTFTYDQDGEPIQTFTLPVRKNKLRKRTKKFKSTSEI